MKRLRVIQIGGEHDHAAGALDSLKRQSDLFELMGIVIPEDDCREQYERNIRHFDGVKRLTLEEALKIDGLDGAVIETSEKKLTRYARIAAENGLHIHMDKPGSEDESEFQDMIRLVKASGKVFSQGYMYRFNPAVREVMAMKARGDLGEILYVQAQMNCLHAADKREWLARYRGGMMFFLGCHLIDLILQLQGEPLEVIPYNMRTGLDGASGEDFGMALLRYPRGVSLAQTTAVEMGGFMRRQLVVVGTKATAEINPLEYIVDDPVMNQQCDLYVTTAEECARRHWRARGEKMTFAPYNRYDGMLRAWGEAALGRGPSPTNIDYEATLHRYVLKASGIC